MSLVFIIVLNHHLTTAVNTVLVKFFFKGWNTIKGQLYKSVSRKRSVVLRLKLKLNPVNTHTSHLGPSVSNIIPPVLCKYSFVVSKLQTKDNAF